eukprot:SM000022S07289  [mRNA]  locus=s22:1060763:1061529:- [translate_table: standard]
MANFGLARTFQAHDTHVSTLAAGSSRCPPMSVELCRRPLCDAFNFGVMLLETVTGKRPVDPFFQTKISSGGNLISWVRFCHRHEKPLECVDMALAPFKVDEVRGALRLGLICCSDIPKQRPTMVDVIEMLQNLGAFGAGLTFPKLIDATG